MQSFKMILIFMLAIFLCCSHKKNTTEDLSSNSYAFVITSDYQTGSYSAIDLESLKSVNDIGMGLIHSDARAKYFNGKVYIVNRYGRDNIQILDPLNQLATISEISMGSSSNPQDIIVVGEDKAYVTRFGSNELWIINPALGAKTGAIDLSGYAPTVNNGIPDMAMMYYSTDSKLLFVSLQRLAPDWSPTEYSSVIVINTVNDQVVKEIKLSWDDNGTPVYAKNPYTNFRYVSKDNWQPNTEDNNDHLFLSCVGACGYKYQADGGIIAVDMVDLHCENGFIITESSINSEIMDFVVKSKTEAYAVTSDINYNSTFIKFNPQTGTITSVLKTNGDNNGTLWSLALHSSGKLFMCDRYALNPGVRIYDTNNNDLPLNDNNPVNVGLPPLDIAFIEN